MALPKIDLPIYEVKLPFSKKKVKFRPFLVKEQKLLMMALEGQEKESTETAMRQILNNCTLDNTDIESLPVIDIEYYFYNLRARSIGEIVESKYRCQNLISDDTVCNNLMEVSLNILNDITLSNTDISNIIPLTNSIGIKLKYPDLTTVKSLTTETSTMTDTTFELISGCIESIYEDDSVYYAHESTKEEIIEFLESLNKKQFESILNFFNNLPRLKSSKEITCEKCGFVHNIEIDNVESFFE